MAGKHIGFIRCDHAHCNEIAEVRQAQGNRSSLYTVCPQCKTDQSNGEERQRWLLANTVDDKESLKDQEPIGQLEPEPEPEPAEAEPEPTNEADNEPPKPSKTEASSELKQAENKPITKPKALPKAPVLFGVVAVILAVLGAIAYFLFGRKSNEGAGN